MVFEYLVANKNRKKINENDQTIWLNDNLRVFKDFMSRALLCIMGAQFHPNKNLKEVLVSITPLKQLHKQIIIKFLLKCFYKMT